MKEVGKIMRPFRYDLNQIPYDYTAEVINRFIGLDLTDRVPEELQTVGNIVQEAVIKTIPKKKKCKKGNGFLRRPYKGLRKEEKLKAKKKSKACNQHLQLLWSPQK